jgi:hypothetical protein
VPPEEFFSGTTQAGRTLVLFYEHTAFDTFTDETGETFDNPSEMKITGTLDGHPIDVQEINWSGGAATVRSNGLGTFTATNTDYAEDLTEALRRYLENRPSEGYGVAIVDKAQEGDEASYTVTITNGRRPIVRSSGSRRRLCGRWRAGPMRRPTSKCATRSHSASGGTSGKRSRS